jgi:hypothetical protein
MLKHVLFLLYRWLGSKEARILAVKICRHLATKTDNIMDDKLVERVAKVLGVE